MIASDCVIAWGEVNIILRACMKENARANPSLGSWTFSPPGHGEQSEALIRGTRCQTCLVKVRSPGRVRVTTLTTPSGPGETSVTLARGQL